MEREEILAKIKEKAGGIMPLSAETKLPYRTLYRHFNRGYLGGDQAVVIGKKYGIDPERLMRSPG